MLQPSPDMGDTCLVEWASGSQRVYETGWGDRFELVHLETSRTSGAPVMGSDWTDIKVRQNALLWEGGELKRPAFLSVSRVVGGTAVERGTHWTYRGAEPGVGSIFAAASGRRAVARPGKSLSSEVWHVHLETCLRNLRCAAGMPYAGIRVRSASQFVFSAEDLARR